MADPSETRSKAAAGACPVDHNAREAWLKQAREQQHAQHTLSYPPHPVPTKPAEPSKSWLDSLASYVPFTSSSSPQETQPPALQKPPRHPGLDTQREVSTIPRTSLRESATQVATVSASGAMAASHGFPANNERETGADPGTGNWIYPSERMFFEAMRRKGHDAREADMRVVVPIHNAVNERAWAEIKEWEKPYLQGTQCATPRLHSFSGDSTRMSPKARINTLLGYQAPFDRHDWVVDRCGTQIEYLIDFYAGRDAIANGKPSFYLDVRPKLNSWEGVKMRALRALGIY